MQQFQGLSFLFTSFEIFLYFDWKLPAIIWKDMPPSWQCLSEHKLNCDDRIVARRRFGDGYKKNLCTRVSPEYRGLHYSITRSRLYWDLDKLKTPQKGFMSLVKIAPIESFLVQRSHGFNEKLEARVQLKQTSRSEESMTELQKSSEEMELSSGGYS